MRELIDRNLVELSQRIPPIFLARLLGRCVDAGQMVGRGPITRSTGPACELLLPPSPFGVVDRAEAGIGALRGRSGSGRSLGDGRSRGDGSKSQGGKEARGQGNSPFR